MRFIALAAMVLLAAVPAGAQTSALSRLTIYDAGVAEVLEERTVDLQTGVNVIEWRSLLPSAHLSTVRVTVDGAEVIRQDVTLDGARLNSTPSPVLHLQIRNAGAPGKRTVRVDYLVPNIGWRADYSLVFEQSPTGAPPTSAELEAWVSVDNNIGADLTADTVDLVAGEIALLVAGSRRSGMVAMQNMAANNVSDEEFAPSTASAEGISAFTRFTLGRSLSLQSNAEISRFPIIPRAKVTLVQRNVFENGYDDQTLARGGFILLPRGLEVRLVSANTSGVQMPAGTITVYARIGGIPQIVGQDVIGHTAPGEQFTASLGRSSTLLGTRRIVESKRIEYRESDGDTAYKKLTTIEVELTNRGKAEADAFIRDGIEQFGQGTWTVLTSTLAPERLSAKTLQFQVKVPAGGSTKVSYTVEIK